MQIVQILTLVTFGNLTVKVDASAKEEVTTSEEVPSIHAVKVDASAKEEGATSEEVPPIHAVKSSASHP